MKYRDIKWEWDNAAWPRSSVPISMLESSAHVQQFSSCSPDPTCSLHDLQLLVLHLVMWGPPKWVSSHKPNVLSLASIERLSQTRSMFTPPSQWWGRCADHLVPLEDSKSFFLKWTWPHCCLRCKIGLNISFTLANGQSQPVAPAPPPPKLLLSVFHYEVLISCWGACPSWCSPHSWSFSLALLLVHIAFILVHHIAVRSSSLTLICHVEMLTHLVVASSIP